MKFLEYLNCKKVNGFLKSFRSIKAKSQLSFMFIYFIVHNTGYQSTNNHLCFAQGIR